MATKCSLRPLLIRGDGLTKSEQITIQSKYEEMGKDSFTELVQRKKILPFAANTLCNCGIDREYWSSVLNEYRIRNRKIIDVLDKIYATFKSEQVNKIFVSENFGALLASGNDIGLFGSGDIDNYADPCEKERLYRAFDKLGWKRKERYSGKHQIAAEFFPQESESLPDKFYFSVDFYPLARLKLPCFINADDFVEWDKVYEYKETNIKLPPNEALTYICMLHISLHSFSRAPDIRLYFDLLNTSKINVNFKKIAEWAKRDAVCVRISVASELSNLLMKTSYPDLLTKLSKRNNKIKRIVYDVSINDLIYDPNKLKVMLIESFCDDQNILHGINKILFPDGEWTYRVYGEKGIKGYIKHWRKVF